MNVPLQAPALRRPAVFDQLWTDLTFLHWAVEPSLVAPFLPAGTRPDLFDGMTYVGLVPFRMHRAGPGRGLPVPYFGTFFETNVRLYSVDDAGRHGVVFRTLECARLAVVLLARLGLRLPYTWARMSSSPAGQPVRRYSSARRWPRSPAARTEIAVRVGAVISPTPLEQFLTARWGMHSSWAGRTIWTPNRHDSWPLHEAELVSLDDGLCAATGVPVTGLPTLRPLYSPGVHTLFGVPSLVPSLVAGTASRSAG